MNSSRFAQTELTRDLSIHEGAGTHFTSNGPADLASGIDIIVKQETNIVKVPNVLVGEAINSSIAEFGRNQPKLDGP